MFKKLLEKFRKKQELELSTDELDKWLSNKKSEAEKELEPICKELLLSLKECLDEFQVNLDNLAKAEIKDKVEQRIISVVLGNRKSYINQSNFFINRINPPNYENINQVIKFDENLKNELNNFATATHKSFYTSQHLFYKEIEELKKTISKISKLNNNFDKKVVESKIKRFEDVENSLNMLKGSIENKSNLVKEINKLEIRLNKSKENKTEYEESIKQIKISPSYKFYQEEKDKLNRLNNKIKELQMQLDHNFSILDYALKKYTHIADEEFQIIHSYQQNPFNALLNDKDLVILEILQKLTKKVLENKLVLRDSKRQKILSEIHLINRDYLGKLIEKYRMLEKQKKALLEQINKNKIMHEIEETNKKIKDFDKELEFLEKDINTLNKNIDKIDNNEIKTGVEQLFKNVFDIELKLVENDKGIHKEIL